MAASKIVQCLLALIVLVAFHPSLTRGYAYCRYSRGCYICRYRRPTRDSCLAYRYCFNRLHGPQKPVCILHERQQEERSCGIHPTRDIVGGSQTSEGDWPWQVSLQTRYSVHICGGVLIDQRWVLTAGHCVHRTKNDDLVVVLGEFDLRRKSGHEQFYRIQKIVVHPYFHFGGNYPNDVALLQLQNDVHYNEYISPACLPSFRDYYADNSCYITGWGETRATGDKSRLRVLQVTPLNPNECTRYWAGAVRPQLHICVNHGLKGACSGDSGGPLSCVRKSDGRFVVAGLTSWGDRSCHRYGYPSIYTNIRTFVPWIDYIIRSNKSK